MITYLLWKGQDMSDWIGPTSWFDWAFAIAIDVAFVAWAISLIRWVAP